MLSFFSKKRHSPDTPNEEFIQGRPDSTQNNNADDFVFIEKKGNVDPVPQMSTHPMYPSMPAGYPSSYPMPPYPVRGPQMPAPVNTNQSVVPYVQDVPFVLAPQLLVKNSSDLTQIQVDGILALLTRQISMEEKEDYNFDLEKSIQNECY